jgi:hypothetical protein
MVFHPLASALRFAFVTAVGLTLLGSAALAQGGQQTERGQHVYGAAGSAAHATYPAERPYGGSVPYDYSSSSVCINGYRWITREYNAWEDPAQNAVPVRCN